MLHRLLALGLAASAAASPAAAGYVRATYSGTIVETGPTVPAGLTAGTSITFAVTYDPAKLVDRTASFEQQVGPGIFTSVGAVSLSDDPRASLRITAGPVTFTKRDSLQYGTPFGDCSPGRLRTVGTGRWQPACRALFERRLLGRRQHLHQPPRLQP